MKILVIGDFHGEFPSKFNKIIDKERVDLVVSLGDYPPFHYRKLWFKHCYGKEVELWEIIGKKKYKELVMEDLRRAEIALKKLNKLKVPVYTVMGNMDWPAIDDIVDVKKFPKNYNKKQPNWERVDLLYKRMKKYKNIHRFDYKSLRFGDYIFIGMRGHTVPGIPESKGFKRYKKKLEKLFRKYKKEKIIFVSHNIAFNTKLDLISMKSLGKALKSYYGKKYNKKKKYHRHYGSKMARMMIEEHKPILHLGGHIHESFGKDKIGKTILINPGAAHEGKATIVDIEGKDVKNIKFIK